MGAKLPGAVPRRREPDEAEDAVRRIDRKGELERLLMLLAWVKERDERARRDPEQSDD